MIKNLELSIAINVQPSKIWKALWDDKNYREWVSVFFEGSYAVTDNWKVGSTVHFLGPDKSGIYSHIEKHIPNSYIEFKHIGNVINGKEQPLDDDTKKWTGSTEIYKIEERNNVTTLKVEIDVMKEHLEFMTKTFPKALDVVKNICNQLPNQ